MVVQGSIDKREVVDVCGSLYDSYRVISSEQVSNVSAGYNSQTASNDPNGFATSMVRSFQGMSSAALTLTAIGSIYAIGVLMTLALSATAKDYYKSGM